MKTEDGPNQMYAGCSCPVFPAQAMKTKKSNLKDVNLI